jgi:hypothetical protein
MPGILLKVPFSAYYQLHAGFLLGLFLGTEDGGDIPPKRGLTFSKLNLISVHLSQIT